MLENPQIAPRILLVPRPLPRFVDDVHERIAWERKLARILMETGEPAPRGRNGKLIGYRSAEDDPSRLRGLPAIGRNVAGALRGSNPVGALLQKKENQRRR